MTHIVREFKLSDIVQLEQCIIELQDAERDLEPDLVAGITISKRLG